MQNLVEIIEILRKKLEYLGISLGLCHPEVLKVSQQLDSVLNIYQKEERKQKEDLLFGIIALFKREFLTYGCSECDINFFINSALPKEKGLLELDNNEIDNLSSCLGRCLDNARQNKYLAINYIRKTANKYIGTI